jgi:hypothetical protein
LKSIGKFHSILESVTFISICPSFALKRFTPLIDVPSNLLPETTTGAQALNHEGKEIDSMYGFKVSLISNSNISGLIVPFLDTLKCPLTAVIYNETLH